MRWHLIRLLKISWKDCDNETKKFVHTNCTMQRSKCRDELVAPINVNPRARVSRRITKRPSFEVAVAADLKDMRCNVRPLPRRCGDKYCRFAVDVDFDCAPEVTWSSCGQGEAEFLLDIDVDGKMDCPKPKKNDCRPCRPKPVPRRRKRSCGCRKCRSRR